MNPLVLILAYFVLFPKPKPEQDEFVPVKVKDSKENKIYIKPQLLEIEEPQTTRFDAYQAPQQTLEGAVVKQSGKTTVQPKWVDKAMRNNKQNKTETLA